MKRSIVLPFLALAGASPLLAGALFEMEFTDHRSVPAAVSAAEVRVEGRKLRMKIPADGPAASHELIFHGETSELLVVDHDQKSYYVIDREGLDKIAAQLDSAAKQMEQALAAVPAEQRAMMEKMMKQRMPQAAAPRPPIEVRPTGEREETHGYPCVKYELLREGDKVGESWVTDWDNIEGGAELAATFEQMSDLFREFSATVTRAAGKMGGFAAQMDDSPFDHMKAMKGFPVVSRELDDGDLESESILRSAKQESFEPDAFEPPARYKQRKLFEGR